MSTPSPAPATRLPPGAAAGAGYALAILFLINTLNFFDRQLLGSLGEPIRKEFALNDTGLGFLGTIFTLVYAVVGLPLGSLSDRWQRTRLIAAGTAVWSMLTAATGLAHSYTQLFVSRLGVGIGEAVFAPAGQSLIGDYFPRHRRAFAMGTFMLGLPAGVFASYMLAGLIGARWGWRTAFLIACLPGLLLALLALFMREPGRGFHDGAPVAMAAPGSRAFIDVLRLPTIRWIIISGIFHNFNMYALASFSTPFLQRFHELTLRQASNVSAVAVGAVGAIGLLGGGWLADRLSRHRRHARLQVSAVCMAITAPCICLALNQPKGAVAAYAVLMGLGTVTMYVYYATVYSAIQEVVEARLRGTAVAIYFCCMYVFGASLGPVGTGMLSDYFSHRALREAGAATLTEAYRAAGLHQAMYVIPVLALLAALVLWAGSRSMAADLRRQRPA